MNLSNYLFRTDSLVMISIACSLLARRDGCHLNN